MSFLRWIGPAAVALAALPTCVLALPCVVFDTDWNLYAFGVQGQYDWSLGTQDTWNSGFVFRSSLGLDYPSAGSDLPAPRLLNL